MAQCRCPICQGFGSESLGGYCKRHHPNSRAMDLAGKGEIPDKHILDDFHEKAEISGGFFSDDFGVIEKGFGYER